MRYCGIFDPVLLGRTTLRQYDLMMKAIRLRLTDKVYDIHLQAWLNMRVKATKQQGKKIMPYYKNFDEFFKIQEDDDTPERRQKEREQDQLKALILKANTNAASGG